MSPTHANGTENPPEETSWPRGLDPAVYHRIAFEQSLDAILVTDAEGHQLDANEAALALLGHGQDALRDLSLGDLLALSPARLDELRAHVATRDEPWQGESAIATRDGRVIAAALRLSSIRTSARQLVATTAIVHDITAQKAAEEELATTHHHAREVLERVSDGFYALDRDWRFTYVNQAAEQIMARPRAELLGAVAWDAFPQALATSIFDDLRLVLESGEKAEFDYYYPPYARWFSLRAYPSAQGLALFFRDVTAAKRLDQDIAEALQAARSIASTHSQFAAMMSHELRTPLQAILGYADLLLSGRSGLLTRAQHDDIRSIREGAGRMATLIEQILVLARIGTGDTALSSQAVDLALIMTQIERELAPQAREKGLGFEVMLPSTLPAAQGDPMYVRQIVHNLVSNAIKFTAQGAVRITAQTSDGDVALAVSDTGIGIAPEELPHVFEAFQQAESGPIRRYEGAGLGLTIARRLAEQMGGRISVQSEQEIGSTFTLYLPMARSLPSRTWRSRRLPGT